MGTSEVDKREPGYFQAPGFKYDPEVPATGNIYRDVFYFEGKRYISWTIGCARCGEEAHLDRVGRYKRSKTRAREMGYVQDEQEKWVCAKCQKRGRKIDE
jgi:hypothetical protein